METNDTSISKVTSKSQTVLPLAVRERLGIRPGDLIRYRFRGKRVEIEKLVLDPAEDPFVSFTEWGSKADEDAYGKL